MCKLLSIGEDRYPFKEIRKKNSWKKPVTVLKSASNLKAIISFYKCKKSFLDQ